jgi:hypothetical protein
MRLDRVSFQELLEFGHLILRYCEKAYAVSKVSEARYDNTNGVDVGCRERQHKFEPSTQLKAKRHL